MLGRRPAWSGGRVRLIAAALKAAGPMGPGVRIPPAPLLAAPAPPPQRWRRGGRGRERTTAGGDARQGPAVRPGTRSTGAGAGGGSGAGGGRRGEGGGRGAGAPAGPAARRV